MNADEIQKVLVEDIDRSWMGVKNGKGFYTYPDPAFRRPEFLTAADRSAFDHTDKGESV